MARKLDKKAIEARIKANKETMRVSKREVTDFMNTTTKGTCTTPAADARKSLTAFIKAAEAMSQDASKLASLDAAVEA